MEWRSSTDKEKYGDMIGEVIHHTLYEDGSITNYDVKFGNRTIKNIPADKLESVKEQSHGHKPTNAGKAPSKKKEKIHGDKDVEEGILGGLAGFTMAGGLEPGEPLAKSLAGTYLGHKIQQYIYSKATNVENRLFYIQVLKKRSPVFIPIFIFNFFPFKIF